MATRTHKVLMFVALAAAACTEAYDAKRVLEGAGYTDISTGGYAWTGCGSQLATRFTATGPSGRPVSGAVCNSLPGHKISLD